MSRKPRVDISVPFTALKRRPSAAFEWLDKEPFYAPLLDIMLVTGVKRFRTFALLDTGAGTCIFGTKIADGLGIDWKGCPDIDIAGFGGDFKGYGTDVKLVIPSSHYAWETRVVFSPAMDRGPYAGILGHHGFFEHFEVRFKGTRFSVCLK